ncbi:MAG: hypothetical protein IKG42_03730 [Clostridia bacterium]|nr:hypothetical protein [Clostridia bacterium]
MVKYLRQVQECIQCIEYGIAEDKLFVRDNCNEYISIVEELISIIDIFINVRIENLEFWYSENISVVFGENSNSIFDRIKKFFKKQICNYKMNKLSDEMHYLKVYRKRLQNIVTRLNQIRYLL